MLKDKWIYTELAKINDTALQKNSLQFWPKKKKNASAECLTNQLLASIKLQWHNRATSVCSGQHHSVQLCNETRASGKWKKKDSKPSFHSCSFGLAYTSEV